MNIIGTIENTVALEQLKDKHKGETAYLLGTGPSLNEVDFGLLKDKLLIGCNSLLRGYSKFGIRCSYYCCSDGYTYEQLGAEIMALEDTEKFICHGAVKHYNNNPVGKNRFVPELGYLWFDREVSFDLLLGTYNGGTVMVDIMIPLAVWMGCTRIVLLGCDCSYAASHHFDDYVEHVAAPPLQGGWTKIFFSYSLLKCELDSIDVEVYNATDGTKLDVFTKKPLSELG